MQTSSKFQHPSALAERLFRKFAAIYGSQKMAAMWAGIVPADATESERREAEAEVHATWADGLADFHIDVIARAVKDLMREGDSWPPALTDFVKLCAAAEEKVKAERRMLALPPPSDVADPNSPAVQAFKDQMAKFLRRHRP